MTISWSDARTSVRGDLWRPSVAGVPDDVCDRALHASLLRLEAERRWLWLEAIRHSVVLSDPASSIALPPECQFVVSLSYKDGSDEMVLLDRKQLTCVRADVSEGGQQPDAYSVQGSTAFLNATAPVGAEFEVIFNAGTSTDLASAIAGSATNIALQRERSAVIASACAQVAGTFLKNEAEEARQERAYARLLERLHNVEDDARSDNYGGFIQPFSFGGLTHGW